MAGTQHFSPGDIQFQLVYDKGQCAESSYLKYKTEGAEDFVLGQGNIYAQFVGP